MLSAEVIAKHKMFHKMLSVGNKYGVWKKTTTYQALRDADRVLAVCDADRDEYAVTRRNLHVGDVRGLTFNVLDTRTRARYSV